MGKSPKETTKRAEHKIAVELVPDAWPRFEQFIKQVAKAGPQHREKPAPKPHTSPAAKKHKKRVTKRLDESQ